MTRLEYIEDLVTQGLSSKEIYEKAQVFDADNETEEEVKTEVVADQTDAPVTTTQEEASEDTDSQSTDGSSEFQPTINPGQTITRNDGYEYKYELNPEDNTQGVYYSRKIGSDSEWTNANENTSDKGNVAKASIANLFGHSSFGDKEREQYFSGVEQNKQLELDKKEAIKQYQADEELGFLGMLKEGFTGETDDWFDFDKTRIVEGLARGTGEGIENILRGNNELLSKSVLEPIMGAINYTGIMDLSDYEDDSWDGINLDNAFDNIITEYAIGEGATPGAYGDNYDFEEQSGDRIEAGILGIAASMAATPKLLNDTKKLIGETAGKILPQGAIDFINGPGMKMFKNMNPSLGFAADIMTQKDLIESGQKAYDVFNKKSNQLNTTLFDFNNVGMTATLGKSLNPFGDDISGKERLGAFLTGSARITSSALGSLPSVAQSMIPYVGIASIVAGEAAKTNMESAKDGRPLDWARLGHAYVIGASEGLLELVTKKIGGNMLKNLRGSSKEVIKKSLLQYGRQVVKEFGQEGLSEVATLLINQAADKLYKDEVDEWFPAWGEVMDTFMIGGVMGGGMSLAGAGFAIVRNTIESKRISKSMKVSGDTSISSIVDGVTEAVTGMEDSNVKIQRADNENVSDNVTPEDIEQKQASENQQETNTDNVVKSNKDVTKNTKSNKSSKTSRTQLNEESSNVTEESADIKDVQAETNKKTESKPKPEYTADEKADARHKVLTNPKAEMFLNTELKRKVESGEMTTTKSDEIKAKFRTQQGIANQIDGLGYTGQARQSIINLNSELFDLQEKIKDAPKSLTKPEQDRIQEIESELASIPRNAQQQAAINKKVDREAKLVVDNSRGKAKSFETTAEFMEVTGETDPTVDAFINKNGEIFINKQKMREYGAVGVGRHELLHKILKSQFQGEEGQELAQEFLDILEKEDPAGFKLLMSRITQEDSSGKRIYDDTYLEENPDEYLAMFSSLVAEGQITQESIVEKPSLIKKLSDFFSRILSGAANKDTTGQDVKPSDIDFKNGQDLYDFVKSYNKNAESGVISDRAQKLIDKGESITGKGKVTSKTITPLEAINNLMPADIKTKEQFDKWIRSESEGGKIIADALKPGGVISNYIKSGKTIQESDKMLDDIVGRIFNFNPEAKRKNGTTVGPKAFGERIFADSAWANVTARTQLFQEGEKAKKERSLDSDLDLQIEGDAGKTNTSRVVEKLTDLRKKGVMKNISSEQVGELITAIEQDIEGQDLTGKNYKNINPGQALANAWGKIFGLNPELLYQIGKPGTQKAGKDVSSKRSVAEGDNAAFAKLRTFLNANAQNLINVLPEGTTYDGKATGIPENVKNLFYTKNSNGKLVKRKNISPKEIKDAMAAPDGALYKSSQAQTIKGINKLFFKGLLNTTVTQNQLSKGKSPTEVAVNKEGSSKRAFSRTITKAKATEALVFRGKNQGITMEKVQDLVPGKNWSELTRKEQVSEILEAIEVLNKELGFNIATSINLIEKGDPQTAGSKKQLYITSLANVNENKNISSKRKAEIKKQVEDGELIDLSAIQNSNLIPLTSTDAAGTQKTKPGKNQTKEQSIKFRVDKNLEDITDITQAKEKVFENLLNAISKNPSLLGAINSLMYKVNNNSSAFRNMGTLIGMILQKGYNQNITVGEHVLQYNEMINLLEVAGITMDPLLFEEMSKWLAENYIQVQTTNNTKDVPGKKGKKIGSKSGSGIAIQEDNYPSGSKNLFTNKNDLAAWDAKNTMLPALLQQIIEARNGKRAWKDVGSSLSKYFSPYGYYNANTFKIGDADGNLVSIAEVWGAKVPTKYQGTDSNGNSDFPNVVQKQAEILSQTLLKQITIAKGQQMMDAYINSIAEGQQKAGEQNSKMFKGKVNKNMTITDQVNVLENYDKTLKFSRSLNTKPKGISVFDFDDTLAKTNSKVIVTMPESVQSVTNTGDAKKVINTVYKSVINAVANNSNINTISFSSEFNEKSRVKLYNSLANKLSKDLGWELESFETVDSIGNNDVVTSEDFTLTKGKDAKKIKGDKNAIKFKKDVADNLKSSFNINEKTYDVSLDFRGEGDYSLEFSLRGESKGKTYKINATEFAEQSADLEAQGAEFNFDEFSKVIDGKKGPLADLALKRQDKFGSGDIFVLTARPQAAAQGIKTFLDGIGLNLPLKNITGLENGTPEAKANWVISKTAEGYNDFYFADDAIGNVKAVKNILDQVDVKSKVQQAKYSKTITFDKIMNDIIEGKTGIKSEAEFSKARAQTTGAKKGRFTFFTTPSAEDFKGLLYRLLGKGKVGDAQFQFFQDNLIDPYNRAEQAVTRAKISAANNFKALKNSLKTLPKSLSKLTGIGGFTFAQAARVAVWTRQGMEVPGLSKRDAKELNDFVDNNPELDIFANELIKIQKGKPYPAPGQNWLAGNITSDIVNEINKVNRVEYMQEFNENLDIILSDKVMNKLEAAYGPRYVEALRDQIRRMKSGSNRPIGNSRIVDQILNWLNNSVGAIMFLNTRSAVLQTISAVNFINFGNNNLIAAGKALLNQKQYWKDFMTLMNSPYLVERRDGLKINVSESEIADAVSESSNKPKAFLNLLLSKGFILTRIADSFAIAAGGSTFYRNQIKAYMKSGMDQQAAEKQAFDDFYAIAEESQQSSNPSKISQQQASGAGRVILAFANTPMQYARIIKRATQDLINGRGDWKSNVSKIVYYAAIQNLIFNALSNALFALAFSEEEEEQEDKTGRIANGMADSLLRGLGIQGAAVAAVKDALFTIYKEANKEKGAPEFRKAINDLFGFSPPLDSKIRKLNSGANTLSWEQEKMKEEGFNLNNPAYLATAQIIAGLTNIPLDRAIQKINNIRAATSDSSDKWQKVALLMGWSAWDLGLPYYGVEDKEVQTPQTILRDKVLKMKKETSGKEQKQMLLDLGLTKQEIVKLKYEEIRIKKIIELQNKN